MSYGVYVNVVPRPLNFFVPVSGRKIVEQRKWGRSSGHRVWVIGLAQKMQWNKNKTNSLPHKDGYYMSQLIKN